MELNSTLRPGLLLRFENEPWKVLDRSPALLVTLQRISDRTVRQEPLEVILSEPTYRILYGTELDDRLFGQPQAGLWKLVPDAKRKKALAREKIVLEIATGYSCGHPDRAVEGEPRPEFDPAANHTLASRIGAMRGELAATGSPLLRSDRQIERWIASYFGTKKTAPQGIIGLVDAHVFAARGPINHADPRYLTILNELITENRSEPTHSRDWYWQQAAARCLARYGPRVVREPGRSQFYELWKLVGVPAGAQAPTTTRITIAEAGVAGEERTSAARPAGTQVHDATTVDLICIDDQTGKPGRVQLGANLDEYSGCVLSVRLVTHMKGIDAGLLAYDPLRPKIAPPGLPPQAYLPYGGVPDEVLWPGLVSDEDKPLLANVPGGSPSAVLFDRGRVYMSDDCRRVLHLLHATIRHAPPYSPWFKGMIEGFFGTGNHRLWQHHVGYVASNTLHRGKPRNVPVFRLLRSQMLRILWEWVMVDFHNLPTKGLRRLQALPQVYFTRKAKFLEGVERGGFPTLPPDPSYALGLLHQQLVKPNRGGVQVAKLPFTGEELQRWVIDGRSNVRPHPYPKNPRGSVTGQVLVAYDPDYLNTILFIHPHTGEPHPLRCRLMDDVYIPFSAGFVEYIWRTLRREYREVTPDRLAYEVGLALTDFQRGAPLHPSVRGAIDQGISKAQASVVKAVGGHGALLLPESAGDRPHLSAGPAATPIDRDDDAGLWPAEDEIEALDGYL